MCGGRGEGTEEAEEEATEPSIGHRPIGGDVNNRLLPLCPSLLLAVVTSSRLSLAPSLARSRGS